MFLQPYNTYIQYTLPIPLSHSRHEIFKTAKQEVSKDTTSRDGIHLLQQLYGKPATKNWIRWSLYSSRTVSSLLIFVLVIQRFTASKFNFWTIVPFQSLSCLDVGNLLRRSYLTLEKA